MATNDISKKIIIKKEYFDNIKTTIDSINSFFSSNFKDKNFPIVDSDFQLDSTLLGIVSWLNNVEPAWISDPSRVDSVIEAINKTAEDMEGDDIYSQLVNENNTVVLDHINAFVGYKVLQYIADYFTEFNKFINGIYTFELYTKPSKYKDVIDLFSKTIPISEIENVMGNAEYRLFDRQKYVTGVFSNNQITLPDTLKQDAEINRLENNDDLDIEIVVDESVQEAAEVNFFEETKPEHLKYDEKKDKWVVSKQFEKAISKLISTLRKCDTTEDLKNVFDKKGEVPEPDTFTSVVIPFILARTYSNPNKYMNENYDKEAMKKYTDSYDSITNKNNGAKRFAKYDIFSTFKTDKEGTIKFIEDFLKLNLVNDESAYISNNTLLTLFNIFDSRIYLDIMYNMLPDKVKKSKYPTEDGFVKLIRARINKNSRSANVYKPDTKVKSGNDVQTSEEIQEYVTDSLKEFGDMSIADMMYCEHYQSLIHDEIKCLGDAMYNKGLSQIQVDNYIGESYDIFEEGFFSNLFGKKNNNQKNSKINDFENKYNVKISEDYKNILLNDVNIKPSYFNIVNILDDRDLKNIGYDFKYLTEFKSSVDTDGLYPIMHSTFDYDDFKFGTVYSDAEGLVYAAIYNKAHRLEKVATNIHEFIESCENRRIYFDHINNHEVSGYTDDDVEICADLIVKTDTSGTILPKVAFEITMLFDSDYFGEIIRNDVIPKLKKALNTDDIDFENDCVFTKLVYESNGNREMYLKYNGKEVTLSSLGITIQQESYNIFDKEDGFIQEQEMGDIPDYMRNRIKLSDETGNNPEVTTTDVQLPPDVPANPVDDLVSSIDAKLSAGGGLEDMLGSGYNDNPNKNHHEGKVVYNITNNYNNSFNRNSNNTNTTTQNDLSTGKTTTTTNTNTNSHNKRYTTHKNPNNYNNSTDSSDTKDSTNMISQTEYATFSTGNSIHDVFTFLESEEPLSDGNDSKPPKGDLLTHAMDRDREKLSKHQERKKTTQKIINTGRAVVKPIARTKKWLTDLVDSLVKRDEDKVKADIIEKPGFRTALFKAGRLALKLGLTGVAFTINGYVGMAYLALQGAKIADRERLKKEVQEEFAAELEILNDKIQLADADNTQQSRKDKWQMMRLRSKMEHIVAGTPRSRIRTRNDIV